MGTQASKKSIGRRYESWWSQAGSNRRPLACHASALPAELWPHTRKILYFNEKFNLISPNRTEKCSSVPTKTSREYQELWRLFRQNIYSAILRTTICNHGLNASGVASIAARIRSYMVLPPM